MLTGPPLLLCGVGTNGIYTFTAPSTGDGSDLVTIDSPAARQTRISGTSGGVALQTVILSHFPKIVVNTGQNDSPGSRDVVTFLGDLSATGVAQLGVQTGAGDDPLDLSQWDSTGFLLL